MRIINILSQLLFFVGLTLKFFHIHYNAVLMLIGLAGVVISLLVGLLKKQERDTLLLTLANFGWLLLIFISVKFLPMQSVFLVIAALLTFLTAILIIRTVKVIRLWPVVISISIALFFFFLPSHKRF